MWKVIGRLLFILGTIGLLLNLILWLPTRINLIIMVPISVVCVVIILGGGKLSQPRIEVEKVQEGKHEPMAQQAQGMQQGIVCPRCGWLGAPGNRFCGACGSSLASVCPGCGAPIAPAAKFCTNCGTRLG
jgi:hypothetical protein